MNGKLKRVRSGQREFVGAYLDEDLKRRLRVLAGLRHTTMSDVIGELVAKETAPLAELIDSGMEQMRA